MIITRDEKIPPKEGQIGDIVAPEVDLSTLSEGISVNQIGFEKNISNISEDDKKELLQMQDNINCARFYTDMDKKMNQVLSRVILVEDNTLREDLASELYDYL